MYYPDISIKTQITSISNVINFNTHCISIYKKSYFHFVFIPEIRLQIQAKLTNKAPDYIKREISREEFYTKQNCQLQELFGSDNGILLESKVSNFGLRYDENKKCLKTIFINHKDKSAISSEIDILQGFIYWQFDDSDFQLGASFYKTKEIFLCKKNQINQININQININQIKRLYIKEINDVRIIYSL